MCLPLSRLCAALMNRHHHHHHHHHHHQHGGDEEEDEDEEHRSIETESEKEKGILEEDPAVEEAALMNIEENASMADAKASSTNGQTSDVNVGANGLAQGGSSKTLVQKDEVCRICGSVIRGVHVLETHTVLCATLKENRNAIDDLDVKLERLRLKVTEKLERNGTRPPSEAESTSKSCLELVCRLARLSREVSSEDFTAMSKLNKLQDELGGALCSGQISSPEITVLQTLEARQRGYQAVP